jgi:polysaccharide pyruvyl transferase WcaK-like protein
MLIEIKGTDFRNKGAELMLRSVVTEVGSWSPRPGLVVAAGMGPYRSRAELGLYQKVAAGRLLRAGLPDPYALLPDSVRGRYGIVVDREIDAIFDASGFAYSSQWGVRSTLRLAQAARQWRRTGKKAVLLPQALGPFDDPVMRDAFRTAVEQVDLVYARDDASYANVMELQVPAEKVRQAPDFTIPLKGTLPGDVDLGDRPAAIVPNLRVVDGGASDRKAYVALLSSSARALAQLGFTPFILVHDSGSDAEIAAELATSIGTGLKQVHREDPLELKGIIGACELLVGSRYHALVAALSQNVPSFAISWSHKYGALLNDYGCPDHMLSPGTAPEEVLALLAPMAAEDSRRAMAAKLATINERNRAATQQMWSEVRALLGNGAGAR